MTAQDQMTTKLAHLTDQQLVNAINRMNKRWDAYTPDERFVRFALLGEYENRHGEDAVDEYMKKLQSEAQQAA